MTHDSYARMMEALQAATGFEPSQTQIGDWIDTSSQTVHNWSTRGVSKDGALELQRVKGVSATWVLNGIEPKIIGGSAVSQAGRVSEAIIAKALDFAALSMRHAGQTFDAVRDVGLLADAIRLVLESEGSDESRTDGENGAVDRQSGKDAKRGTSSPEGGRRAKRVA